MRFVQRVRQLCCRHEDVLKLDDGRMWLECLACGRTTHGFDGLGVPMHAADAAPAAAHRAPIVAHAEWRRRAFDHAA